MDTKERTSRAIPSRSPSHLFGPHPADGTLTPPVLQILERTSATLEHLSLQRASCELASQPGQSEPNALTPYCGRGAHGHAQSCCASSQAAARTGIRSERVQNSPRVQKSKEWAAASARMSPQRKLERYLQVHCSDGKSSARGDHKPSAAPTSTAITCAACADCSVSACPTRRSSDFSHLGRVPSGLCNGSAVAVLSTENLEAMRAERIRRNAERRGTTQDAAPSSTPPAVPSPFFQWPNFQQIHDDISRVLLKSQADIAQAAANVEAGVREWWSQTTKWYWS